MGLVVGFFHRMYGSGVKPIFSQVSVMREWFGKTWNFRFFYFRPLDCCDFSGYAYYAHPVGPVGGNFNIHYYFPSDFLGSFASKPGFGHFPHKILQG